MLRKLFGATPSKNIASRSSEVADQIDESSPDLVASRDLDSGVEDPNDEEERPIASINGSLASDASNRSSSARGSDTGSVTSSPRKHQRKIKAAARNERSSPYARPPSTPTPGSGRFGRTLPRAAESNRATETPDRRKSGGLLDFMKSVASPALSFLRVGSFSPQKEDTAETVDDENDDLPSENELLGENDGDGDALISTPSRPERPNLPRRRSKSIESIPEVIVVDEDESGVPQTAASSNSPSAQGKFNFLADRSLAVPVSKFDPSTTFKFSPGPVQPSKLFSDIQPFKPKSPEAVNRNGNAGELSPTKKAYEELVKFFSQQGDKPLTQEDAEKIQKFIERATDDRKEASSSSSTSEVSLTHVRRESPRASSTYTPLFTAALTVPASSNPLNRSNAPKIRRRPTNYYGASFGVNPYKRDRLKRPINRNLAPSVSLPDPASAAIVVASGGNGAKRVRVDDQEEESAAKLILETLEDMTPPPTSLLPLEPSFAPINPYERLIPASAAPTPKQMPASGKRAKTDAVLRDVKAVVAKAEPKSVLLNAKITDRVKSSGTPAKPPAKNTGKLKPGKIDDVSRPLSPSNTTGPSPSTTSFPIISPPKQVQPPLPVAPLSSFANHLTESGPTSKFPVFGSHNADSDSQKPSQPTFTFTFKAETPKPAVLPISEGPKPGWSEKADSSSQSVDFPSILKEVAVQPLSGIPKFTFSSPQSSSALSSAVLRHLPHLLNVTSQLWQLPKFEFSLKPTESAKAGQDAPVVSWKIPPVAKSVSSAASASALSSVGLSTKTVAPSVTPWFCRVCLVQNSVGATQCVACEAMRPEETPAQKAFPLPTPMMAIKFGASKGWTCNVCLVPNNSAAEKCAACESPAPATTAPAAKSALSTSEEGSSWTCSVCLVPNKPGSNKCAACESPGGSAPVSQGSSTEAKDKKPWTCSVCLVPNKAGLLKCAACESPAPSTNSASRSVVSAGPTTADKTDTTAIPTPNVPSTKPQVALAPTAAKPAFTFSTSSPAGWTCDSCLVANKAEAKKCIACEAPSPSSSSSFQVSSAKAESASDLPGSSSTPPSTSWTCESCLVPNKAEAVAYVACETPHAGGTEKAATDPAPVATEVQPARSLGFAPFSFKPPQPSSSETETTRDGKSPFALTTPAAGGFSFKPAGTLAAFSPPTSGGIPSAAATPFKGGFSFKPAAATSTATVEGQSSTSGKDALAPVTPAAVSGGFSFKPAAGRIGGQTPGQPFGASTEGFSFGGKPAAFGGFSFKPASDPVKAADGSSTTASGRAGGAGGAGGEGGKSDDAVQAESTAGGAGVGGFVFKPSA